MNKQLEAAESQLEERISKIFHEFMTTIMKFEQLSDVAKLFLVRFQQEIEKFRRPNIQNMSDLVCKLIGANYTDRMKAYLEAGSRNVDESAHNISNLHLCHLDLEDHLRKVEGLLREIECLTEDAISIMKVTNQTTSIILEELFGDTHQTLPLEEEEAEPAHLRDKSISLIVIMRILYGMLKLDYAMQEKIIRSLNLMSPSSELESYCLMWDLRPYIDEKFMHFAWKHVKG